MSSGSEKLKFFRQSGWMVFAITTSGVFMYAVHIPAMRRMPEPEYAVFATLLQVLNLMLIPGLSLQTVFTQQTAAVTGPDDHRRLAGAIRKLLWCMAGIWVGSAGLVWLFADNLMRSFRIANPAALWITLLTGLPVLCVPILQGLLQGRQNFLWLGWTVMLNGWGRFLTVLVTVIWLGGHAAGGMFAAFFGFSCALGVALWQTRPLWTGPSQAFEWRPWLAKLIPLTLGLGTSQLMFAVDMIVVQSFFETETGRYAAVGAIARGIVLFAGPVAMVMFPKVVESSRRGQKTDVLQQALVATGSLAGLAAVLCTLLPELPFRLLKPSYLPIAPLLPLFAWSMVPLTIANVLINNLLASSRFAAVPWLLLVAISYTCCLTAVAAYWRTGDDMQDFSLVVKTLGLFNLLLLALAAGFTLPRRAARSNT